MSSNRYKSSIKLSINHEMVTSEIVDINSFSRVRVIEVKEDPLEMYRKSLKLLRVVQPLEIWIKHTAKNQYVVLMKLKAVLRR